MLMAVFVLMGGKMGGEINYEDFPMVMEVDYVRVYKR